MAPTCQGVDELTCWAEQTPDDKAASIINSVPTSSLWTKTGGVVLGTAVTAAAVSTELYVRLRRSDRAGVGYPEDGWLTVLI